MPAPDLDAPIVTLLAARTYVTSEDFGENTPVDAELDSHGGVARVRFSLQPALNSGQLESLDLNDSEKVHEFETHIEQWLKEEIDGFVPDRVMAEVDTRNAILALSWRVVATRCGESVQDFWAEGLRDPAEVVISAFKNPRWPDNLK